MRVSRIHSLWALCALGALPLLACSADDRQGTVDRKVAATATGDVLISGVSGSIDVRGWDRDEVHVTGYIDDGVERIDVENSGGRTIVKVVIPRGNRGDADANLEVQVPRGSSLEVSVVSADVSSRGVQGSQRLKTVSGEITAEIGGPDSEVRSVSGDITVKSGGKAGTLRVSSVSGSLDLNNAAGKLDVVTVSGDARVHMGEASEVTARTTSGTFELHAKLLRDARVNIESVSGDVDLDVSGASGLALEIESFSGDITGCLAGGAERVSKYGPGVRLNSRTGDGGARVRAKTLSGDIEICDR